jgi:DNA-binding NtrC family response regulator
VPGVVLIVDDDPSIVQSLRDVLPPEVELATASDASSAIATLDGRRFCGLVLDLILAEGNGFDVLRHMKAKQIDLPTVVISSRLPAYVREMLDQDQVKLVFPKPVEPRLLAAVVLGLCGDSMSSP